MSIPARQADVIVVGAGLAGLCAAHHLAAAGVSVIVLEARPRVGGRMATETAGGFRLDRGSSLLNTSYPEFYVTPGLAGLKLRWFAAGVVVRSGGHGYRIGDPRRSRATLSAVRSAGFSPGNRRSPAPSLFDRARLGSALGRLAATPPARLISKPETTAERALAERGLPPRVVDGFLRPLLTALLSDPDLGTSSRCADLVLRGFARGRLCLPEGGAEAVPELMAAGLPPGSVRPGVRAVSVATNAVATADHGELSCRAVVVATGARAAAELLPGLHMPRFQAVTTLHHAAARSPLREPALVLGADRAGPVAHTFVASEVDPARSSDGRALITSTVLGVPRHGTAELAVEARSHLAELYGVPTDDWELLAAHHDPEAVPKMPAPHHFRRPVRVISGLYVCGDHRDTSTPQGTMYSGRRAAQHVLHDFGLRAPDTVPGDRLLAA